MAVSSQQTALALGTLARTSTRAAAAKIVRRIAGITSVGAARLAAPTEVMPAMRRTIFAAAALVLVLASVPSANAVCCDDTAMYVKRGYYVNKQWPWPYVCPDRIAVQEPFCIMVNNSW